MPSSGMCHLRPTIPQAALNVAAWSLMIVPFSAWSQARTHNQSPPPQGSTQSDSTQQPHSTSSGMSGGEEAGIIGGVAAAAAITAWAVHHHQHKLPDTDHLLKNGPQVPQNVQMSHLIIDGLIGPGWPVGVDFQLDDPGSVTLDITTADKGHYREVLAADPKNRAVLILHPQPLPDKLQSAVFDIEAVGPAGSKDTAPSFRIFGIAAGPRAVGSIGIDKVSLGPSLVKMNQMAQYAFHSHSDFTDVRADFMFTGLKDNHVVMKQDSETSLDPVEHGQDKQGPLPTKGTVGQHLLQIRAWRANSGDWAIAWSPEVVTLTK